MTGRDLTVFPSGGESAEELVGAVVKQTYLRQGSLPRELLLPCPLEDQEPLEAMLTERAEHRVSLSVPQRRKKTPGRK